MSIDLRRDGDVFILTMNSGDNRFNRGFLDALNGALDEVERESGPVALVTVGGTEKFYSNGLDLDWLGGDGAAVSREFIGEFIRFLGRVMGMPVPTVAAMNGHAFAGGAMFALAHDYRVMRADRGFFCLPEIDLHMPLAAGMSALISARMTPTALRDAVLTGARYGGAEAAAKQIVDEAHPLDRVLPRAVEIAASLATKDRATLGLLKRGLYGNALAVMQSGEL